MSTTDEAGSPAEMPAPEQDLPPVGGGVRWKRFAAMFTITGAMAVGLVALTAQGVLASSFSISGMKFVVTADKLEGTGFEQFATIDNMIPNSPNAGDSGGQEV